MVLVMILDELVHGASAFVNITTQRVSLFLSVILSNPRFLHYRQECANITTTRV